MKLYDKIQLTGEKAYNWGRHSDLFAYSFASSKVLKLSFESYDTDGFIFARYEDDRTLILRDYRLYTFFAPRSRKL